MSVAALHLHWIFFANAGGLWRDEAGSVQLALLPSLRDVWAMLTHDLSPMLMPLAIRSWSAMGFGGTDFGLRCLGLGIGLLLLASLWTAAAMMRRGTPVVALALAGLDVTVIRAGDSLRAYGLGSALAVLMLALMWRLTQKPNFTNALLAALGAILSVQSLFQDSFFVLAAVCGGIAVCIAERRWRGAVWILAVGALAAATLVPYVHPLVKSQDWWMLEKTGFQFWRGRLYFLEAANYPTPEFKWIWLGLFLIALVFGIIVAVSSRAKMAQDFSGRNLIFFGWISLAAGVAGFLIFLQVADLPTQPWYYVPLIAFIAVCLDAILAPCARWLQPTLAIAIGLLVLINHPTGAAALIRRQTNADIVTARLTDQATAHDYIVVNPWYYGISFVRYYKGAASWDTLPPLGDHSIHRYDQFKIEMQKTNAIQSVLAKIAATLQSGHRVWILTDIKGAEIPPRGSQPRINLPPPPLRISRWSDSPYSVVWQSQAMCFASDHSRRFEKIPIPANQPVNPDEDLRLLVAEGWQTNSTPASVKQTPRKT